MASIKKARQARRAERSGRSPSDIREARQARRQARKKKASGGVYIGNIPKGGKGSITARPKPKKKQRGYGQASEGRTRKVHGGKVMPQAKPN